MALTKVGKEGITGVDNSADATAITIDSSENVTLSGGLNMTSDDPTITMTDSSGTNDIATIQSASGALIFTARDGSADGEIIFKKTDGSATDESMRIDQHGNVLVGGTSNTGFKFLSTASGTQGCVDCVSSSTNGYYALRIDMHANNNYAQLFRQGGSVVGYILTQNGATSYNTSSDYRLKENVTYNFDATTRLKQLKPARFNFIANADTTVDGFLAHEVQTIVPEAVSGEKDAVDADGNIDPQGMDASKIVPLLVKTIQELEARITALESA